MKKILVKNHIQKFLTMRDMEQKQLAEKIGVTRWNIHNWVTGKREPRPEARYKLCEALGVSLHELFYLEESV